MTKARVLATGAKVAATTDGENVVLLLPTNAPDAIASVIELKFTGPLEVERHLPKPQADGSIMLGAEIADVHNSLRAHAKLEGKGNAAKITNWDNAEARVSWDFQATKAGVFVVKADIAGAGGGKLTLSLDQKPMSAEVAAADVTGDRTVELGRISIPKPGSYTLELKPDRNDWKGFDLRAVTLVPAQP